MKREPTYEEKQSQQRIRQIIDTHCNGSQNEFAKKVGIGKSSVSQYVNGTNFPSNVRAYQIAKAFDLDPTWVMGFDPPEESSSKPKLPPTPRDEENTAFETQLLFDKPLREALKIYFTLSLEEKQHIISTIHIIGKRKQEGQS